jgi:hypothetical protein
VTSSNSILAPKRMLMLLTESTKNQLYRNLSAPPTQRHPVGADFKSGPVYF